jgi:hypothetical protein
MKTIEDLKRAAERVSAELLEAVSSGSLPEGSGQQQGSAHRKLPESVRKNFIDLRGELFARGIYDPVLVRFDTATAPQAETKTVAEQLATVAQSL